MSAEITYLATTVTIGSHTISLETDHFPALKPAVGQAADAADALKKKLEEGIAFKMPPGQRIGVNLGDIADWVHHLSETVDASFEWPPLLHNILNNADVGEGDKINEVLHDISVLLWNLSVNTKGSLAFNLQVSFDKDFHDALGIPKVVSNVFSLDSMGVGISYSAGGATGEPG
jgi:hypothetical protein